MLMVVQRLVFRMAAPTAREAMYGTPSLNPFHPSQSRPTDVRAKRPLFHNVAFTVSYRCSLEVKDSPSLGLLPISVTSPRLSLSLAALPPCRRHKQVTHTHPTALLAPSIPLRKPHSHLPLAATILSCKIGHQSQPDLAPAPPFLRVLFCVQRRLIPFVIKCPHCSANT